MATFTVQEALTHAAEHQRYGRLGEAEDICRQILAHQPANVNAIYRLGEIARHQGRNDLAAELLQQAIAIAPRWAIAHLSLGNALRDLGKLDAAIAAYQNAIAFKPDFVHAHHNLAKALGKSGQYDQAIAAYQQVIALRPDDAAAWFGLGHQLRSLGRLDDAIAAAQRAIEIKQDFPKAYFLLGLLLEAQWRMDAAIAAYRQAIALDPGYAWAYCNLGVALKDTGQIEEGVIACRQAIQLDPKHTALHGVLLFILQYHPDYDSEAIAQEQRRWNQQHAIPLAVGIQTHSIERRLNRRLRVGYVSPDFAHHAVGWNILPLYQHHDHSQFEIVSYAQVPNPDAMTAKFQRLSDTWRNIVGLSDEQLANLIREDRVDILVDLSQHMTGDRLLVFARKPAPVQVSFAGYPGSTGLTAIDYRLSDPYLDPVGMDESIYSERTIRLPHSFWCFDPLEWSDIPVNPLPARSNGFITFGSLNNFCKVNDKVLALWARVLREVAGSRLILLAFDGNHRDRTKQFLAREGIDPQRIEFMDRMFRRKYLQAYHRIDLGLDTFPYNGHTTSLDSFWMGVPVVTLVGNTAVARAGWCQLSNLGLTELAGDDADEFVRIAVDLARDIPRLEELRSTLRDRMEKSPLMDAAQFASGIEAAYRKMWAEG